MSIRVPKTQESKKHGTKWKIFETAVNMFASRGYAGVGVRDIAKVVGIKSSSIYNHFEGKDALLELVYEYFDDNFYQNLIAPEAVLDLIPDLSPQDVLEKLSTHTTGEIDEILSKILLIAVAEYNNDVRARKMMSRMQEVMVGRFTTVLNKMVELQVIEPMDVDLCAMIFVSFSISETISRFNGRYLIPYERWQEGRRMLFGLARKR